MKISYNKYKNYYIYFIIIIIIIILLFFIVIKKVNTIFLLVYIKVLDYSIGSYFSQVLLNLNLIPIFEKMIQFGPFLLNLLY